MASYLEELKKRQSTQTTSSTPKSSGSSSYLDNLKARTGQTTQPNPTPTGAPVIAPYNPAKIATGAAAQGQFKPSREGAASTNPTQPKKRGKLALLGGSLAAGTVNFVKGLDDFFYNTLELGGNIIRNDIAPVFLTPEMEAKLTPYIGERKGYDIGQIYANQTEDNSVIGKLQSYERQGTETAIKKSREFADAENENMIWQGIAGGVESIPQTLAAATPVVGSYLLAASSFQNTAEQKWQEALDRGEEPDSTKIMTYAIGSAAIEAATERLNNVFRAFSPGKTVMVASGGRPQLVKGMTGLFENTISPYIDDVTKPTVAEFVKFLGRQGFDEGMEEVYSALATGVLAKWTTDPNANLYSIFEDDGGLISLEGVGKSFIGGFALGAVMPALNTGRAFIKSRKLIESKIGKPMNEISEKDVEEVIRTLRGEAKTQEGKAYLQAKLTSDVANLTLNGGKVLYTDPQSGEQQAFRYSQPTAEGKVLLKGDDGQTMMTVDQAELDAGLQAGLFQPVNLQQPQFNQATPAAQAVNASSLPGQQAPAAVPTAATSAGVAPTIAPVTNAQGKTVNQAVQSFPTKGKQQGQVAVETDGKKIQVIMQIGAVPYTFEIGADTYAKSNNKLQTIELSSKGNQLGMLSQFMARNVDGANMQAVWSAVQAAVDGSAGDYVAQTQAAEQAKAAEQQAKQTKTQADQTMAQVENENRFKKKAREVQQKAADDGRMSKQLVADLKKMDADLEAKGFGDTYYNVTSERNLKKGQKAAREILKASSGKDVVFVYAAGEGDVINGFVVNETADTIYINSAKDTNVMKTIGHELFHLVDNAGHAEEFIQAVLETTGKTKEELTQAQIEQYAKGDPYRAYLESDREQAFKEAIADRAGEVFSSTGFLDGLKSRLGVKKFDALIKKVKEWLDDLRGKAPAAEKEIDALLSAIEKMRTDETAAVEMTAEQVLAEANVVQADSQTDSAAPVAYSYKTWTSSEYVKDREKAAVALSEQLGVSKAKALKYIDDVNSIAKVIADDVVRLDYEADPDTGAIKPNSEYEESIDFSTLCKKRLLATGTFEAIQKALPNMIMTTDDFLKLRQIMTDKKLPVACGICYVEGSRYKLGEYTSKFLKEYKDNHPDSTYTMVDFMVVDNKNAIRKNDPAAYDAYKKFMAKLMFNAPKALEKRTEYKQGELYEKFKNPKKAERKNLMGGLRIQSFSDFEIPHVIDMMQVIVDMAKAKLAGQAYTKVPEFALLLGNTGLKINLSLIGRDGGVDADGNLLFDDVEGMPYKDAIRARNMYSDNVGTILVGMNDQHILAAMAADYIDFIIPYHKSQLSQAMYSRLGLNDYSDYTADQNEKYIEKRTDSKGKPVRPDNYKPNDYWDFNKTGKQNAEKYLQMCAEDGRIPKFAKFLTDNGDGSWSLKADGSTDGYWKLLIDFKMYNNEGVGVPQRPVLPDFNMDEANLMLNEYEGGHRNFPVDQSVVDEFVSDYKSKAEYKGLQYSMKPTSLDQFGGGAFRSPLRAWLTEQVTKDPSRKRAAQEWNALITKAPFKTAYEYEFLGLQDWVTQQKSLTAQEVLDYYDENAALMSEQVYENPNQWIQFSPSHEFPESGAEWSNYRASVITIDKNAVPFEFSNSDTRSHFPNAKSVMMHTRLEDANNLPDYPNGVTYLIEAQSDLHSAGQQRGYRAKEQWPSNKKDETLVKFFEDIGGAEAIDKADTDLRNVLKTVRENFKNTSAKDVLRLAFKQSDLVADAIAQQDFDVSYIRNVWRNIRSNAKNSAEKTFDEIVKGLNYDVDIMAYDNKNVQFVYTLLAAAAEVPVKQDDYSIMLDGVSKDDAANKIIDYLAKPNFVEAMTALQIVQDNYDRAKYKTNASGVSRLIDNLIEAQRALKESNQQEAVIKLNDFWSRYEAVTLYADGIPATPAADLLSNNLRSANVEQLAESFDRSADINPEVPYGKDYMLLGLKTAIRDAVQAGHDAVMWAGWMHAKRWEVEGNLIFAKILTKRGSEIIMQFQTPEMQSPRTMTYEDYVVRDKFGYEIGTKIVEAKEGEVVFGQARTIPEPVLDEETGEVTGFTAGEKIKNSMIPRMYDEELVSQATKYVKQWGVKPEYKEVKGLPGYQWVLPINDQMRQDVMTKGQVAYSMKTHRGTRLYTEEFLSMGTLDKLTEAHKYYDAQSNKKTLSLAAAKIQANPKAAEMEARQIDQTSAVATALRMYFMFQADMLGDHQASADWAWIMVKAAKNAGQAVQAHKMVNRMNPQGIMIMLHHELNSLLSDEAQAKINQLTVGIVNQINRNEEESLKGILPSLQETIQRVLTAEGRVAQLEKKLQNMEQDLKLFEHDPVLQYIRALHSVASRVVPFQDLPKSDKPTDFLKWAIKNKDKYPTMWEMAYDITAATRGLDSNYIKEVEAYFRDFLPKKRQMKFDLNPRRYEDLVAAIKAHYAANDHSANALVNRLMEIGVDPADSALIADTVMQAMAELTKTQKARIVKRLLPPQNRIGKKNPIERLVNLSNEHGLTDADVRATAAHILGLPSISPEMAAEISGLANEIAAIREASNQAGIPLTEEQQRAVDFRMAMLLAKVQAQKPVSIGQKIETFRYMMMLSMFKSMERNIIGNGLFAIADTGKDFTAAIIDRAIFGKNAVVPWPDLKGAIEGAIRGAKYSYEDIMNEVDTSEMDTQYSIDRGRVFNNKFMRMQMKIFRLQMSLPDRISQTAAYESHLQGLMKLATKQALRNGTTPPQYPTAAMKEEAIYFAQKKTFTDDNLISTTFGKMRKVLNQISTLGASETWGLGSVIMPFTRVPGALLMRTIDYSPVSVIRAAVYLGQFGKEVATSVHDETWKQEAGQSWRTSYQKKFSTALADGIFGSAVTLILGYWLRSLGIISGEPPEDKKVKNLRESMGLRGYQLNWSALRRYIMSGFDPNEAKLQEDDILTPYSWAAPMSLGLSIGANYHDASKLLRGADIDKVDKFNKLVMMATLSGTETIANMSLMSGVSNFIQSQQYVSNFTFVEGEESRAPFFLEPFLNAAVSYPSSFIHNGIKAVREMTDNVQRNSYARDYGEYALNLMWNRIPGMSKTLPPRYDVLGNLKEVYRDNGNNVWNVFFNPTWVEKFKPNPTAVTILNMMAEKEGTSVQSKNITPAYAPRSITYKDANGLSKPYQLTPDEQSEFQRIVGVRVQQEFAKIPAGWPMEEQVKAMNEILNAISNEEKDNILKRRGLKN